MQLLDRFGRLTEKVFFSLWMAAAFRPPFMAAKELRLFISSKYSAILSNLPTHCARLKMSGCSKIHICVQLQILLKRSIMSDTWGDRFLSLTHAWKTKKITSKNAKLLKFQVTCLKNSRGFIFRKTSKSARQICLAISSHGKLNKSSLRAFKLSGTFGGGKFSGCTIIKGTSFLGLLKVFSNFVQSWMIRSPSFCVPSSRCRVSSMKEKKAQEETDARPSKNRTILALELENVRFRMKKSRKINST